MGTTYQIANYPGYQMVTGPDLVQQFALHADQCGIEKRIGERVTNISLDGRCKVIRTEAGREIHASTVIIASGAFKRKLNIPGEKELQGKGVVYCSTCDGPLFRDLTIAVIGGGNSALEAAIEMNTLAKKIYLVSVADWSGDQILQDKAAAAERVEVLKFHTATEIHGTDKVQGLTVKNVETGETRKLELDGVFVEIGLFPNSDFALDLLETNERGEVKVDRVGDTGVRGVFAAGDVTDSREKQIVVSAGEGARAALAAFEHLIKQV
jgi:alkyl hydroperoxide reductase subunit F